ncbi:hypothetical protein ACN9MU_04700 [Pseudoduganella sp. R-32]|uniref:hypothetical protein n=1 Tax=Pseudoduganella sp. R-32 TaxID=3404061 RepID=UPI003CE8A9E9
MSLTPTEMFLYGFAGSVAVDIVTAAKVYDAHQIVVPERYHRFMFYVVRLLVAVIAGGLAVAYDIDKPLLAANIGAATPLIVQAFAQGVMPSGAPSVPGTTVPPDPIQETPLK